MAIRDQITVVTKSGAAFVVKATRQGGSVRHEKPDRSNGECWVFVEENKVREEVSRLVVAKDELVSFATGREIEKARRKREA